MIGPHCLYSSFDVFPSAKGSSIHIEHMSRTLFDTYSSGLLYVLGDDELPSWQIDGAFEIIRFQEERANFLERTMAFGQGLEAILERYGKGLQLAHFRDPWSGIPIIERVSAETMCVYEINGLPSIELKYHYAGIGDRTLDKIRDEERRCWERANVVITPSQVIAKNLMGLGVEPCKLQVIPNGAHLVQSIPSRPQDAPARYVIYFGALQQWQGVQVLLKAIAQLTDMSDLKLVICSSSKRRFSKEIRQQIRRLGLADRVLWKERLDREELNKYIAHAQMSVAPLVECARNVEQGCCPLKILESMAMAIPVVASDIPCVREILTDREHGKLVPADRPGELARAIRLLWEYPQECRKMGERARKRVEEHFTWDKCHTTLAELYDRLRKEKILCRGSNKQPRTKLRGIEIKNTI